MKLKLMTYNIWGGQNYEEYLNGTPVENCSRDVSYVAEVIKNARADVVALNEVFNCSEYGNQVAQIAKFTGFEYCHFSSAMPRPALCGDYGNGILSKYPIVNIKEKIIDAEIGVRLAEQRGVFCATLDCNGKMLDVIVSHFGLVEAEKERAVSAVLDFKNKSKNKCVFMGDMNSTRDSEQIKRLQEKFRITNDEKEIITWPVEYVPTELQTFSSPLWNRQIDFIFVDDGVSAIKTESVYSLASDHKALLADIEI